MERHLALLTKLPRPRPLAALRSPNLPGQPGCGAGDSQHAHSQHCAQPCLVYQLSRSSVSFSLPAVNNSQRSCPTQPAQV